MFRSILQSPMGDILIEANETVITKVGFIDDESASVNENEWTLLAKQQLKEYFEGTRNRFELPIAYQGTVFQNQVWQALTTIPYGETRSYQDMAIQINNPKAIRAIGGANNCNEIAIIIPCHRVIGKNGTLVGYEGGLEKKAWLLEHESKWSKKNISYNKE
jgi:methylated-DNA-[protein]-cysteine S-methyltransferase